MTLQQVSDKLGVSPYDLHPDEEEVDYYLHRDISGTFFFESMQELAKDEGITL